MERIVVDVTTGEQRIVPLTPEEIAELQEHRQPEPEPTPDPTPEQKLAAAGLSISELRQLLGLDAGTSPSPD